MFTHLNRRNTYAKMSSISKTLSEIKTLVFLDLESTGLPVYENNTTKITELCLTTVHTDHIRLGVFPRVQNKLNFCFNPCKLISDGSEKITGLSNNLLEPSCRFSKDTVTTINNFLSHNPQPICLVAHNGFKFDFPLLKREVDKTNSSLLENSLCIDSLIAFREIEKNQQNKVREGTSDEVDRNIPIELTPQYDELLFSCEAQAINETTPQKQIIKEASASPSAKRTKLEVRKNLDLDFSTSYKLGDIFYRLTKKNPINSHQADGDVQMLIMCAATLGDSFVDWCNQNAKNFCEVPAMTPGRKIGT